MNTLPHAEKHIKVSYQNMGHRRDRTNYVAIGLSAFDDT